MAGVRRIVVVWALACCLLVGGAGAAHSADGDGAGATGAVHRVDEPIAGEYIVTLRTTDPAAVEARAAELTRGHRGQVLGVYPESLHGFAVQMSDADAQALAADPEVASVEENAVVTVDTTQSPTPSWGLDRVDQTNLPLNNQYSYTGDGAGVRAYVLDTGIRTTHLDFGGRASAPVDFIGGPACNPATQPKSGHGTHVAGTIGGTTYGVAKNVTLISVRVLGCTGSASTDQVIAGVEWVTANAEKPAVANMSLGTAGFVPSINTAVEGSIESGVAYVVAAGNSNKDACGTSPASVPSAITVASTASTDVRSSFSNFGSCVDLFAPGGENSFPGALPIMSDWNTSDTATNGESGTSMATPHVVGAVARFLAANPCATPSDVAGAVIANASVGKVSGAGAGSPNRLLNTSFLGDNAPTVLPCPPTLSVTAGYNVAHLTWSTPGGGSSPVTGYAVYRSTTPGGEGAVPLTTVSGAGASSYDDVTAVGGTTYYYQVAAVNASGEARSAEQSVTPLTPGPPAAPALTAIGGNGHVQLIWSIPADNGSPLTGFTVLRGTTPGGESTLTTLGPTATTFDDTPLTNGTAYYYKVAANNGLGSTPSNEASATPLSSQGAYFPLTPARLMDSRTGNGTIGLPFGPGESRSLQVTGRGGVPATGVGAVVMNVTVTGPTIASHVTVWPGGTAPTASNLNFVAGQTRPNLVTVGVSASGQVNFRLDNGAAHLIADVVGYYGDGTAGGASGARYSPQKPYRILDSRIWPGPWSAGQTRDLGLNNVPNDASAVVLNVTATNPTAATFATLWPSGLPRPNPASNLNVVPGQTAPNLAVVGIGANRKVSLYNDAGSTHFVVDVVGWYGGSTATKLFTPATTPARILDSRYGNAFSTPWGPNQTRELQVASKGPVPGDASAVVMNVTVTNPTVAGFATMFPSGETRPDPASNLNFVPGETAPNLVMVKIGTGGKVSFYNLAGTTDMIADVVGWFR
jgi:subtilisin family serine protease